MGALRPTGLSSSAFSTRYLMEHNANVATVGPANILRRRPEVNIYAAFRISKSVECVHYPDVYLEVQHPCWSCNSNSSSANASAGVR